MSTGEQIKPPNRAHHATSKLAKRKLENLIQNQANQADSNNLAYNSFEDMGHDTEMNGNRQLAPAGHQSNAHHSLSMFDSEANLNN